MLGVKIDERLVYFKYPINQSLSPVATCPRSSERSTSSLGSIACKDAI